MNTLAAGEERGGVEKTKSFGTKSFSDLCMLVVVRCLMASSDTLISKEKKQEAEGPIDLLWEFTLD